MTRQPSSRRILPRRSSALLARDAVSRRIYPLREIGHHRDRPDRPAITIARQTDQLGIHPPRRGKGGAFVHAIGHRLQAPQEHQRQGQTHASMGLRQGQEISGGEHDHGKRIGGDHLAIVDHAGAIERAEQVAGRELMEQDQPAIESIELRHGMPRNDQEDIGGTAARCKNDRAGPIIFTSAALDERRRHAGRTAERRRKE